MDVMYEYSMGADGSTPSLGTKFEATDDIERNILNEITGVPMGLDTKTTCFQGDKKKEELFFGLIINITESLFKANTHKKSYKKKENKTVKKFKNDTLKDLNKTLDIKLNPIELFNELDGFLSHIKSALDSVAQALNPLLGATFNGWHKKKNKDGIEKSGTIILNFLERNIPKEQMQRIRNLYNLIKLNVDWISFLVNLRDKPVHKGGLTNVSQLVFSQSKQKVIKQHITHIDGTEEKVDEFMERTIKDIIIFINGIIVLAIQYKSPNLIAVRTIGNNGYPLYRWTIPQ